MKMDRKTTLTLGGAAILFLLFFIFFFAGSSALQVYSGPALILGFTLLALGFRGIEALRGFSYTLTIFAAVSAAMFYPQYFTQVGDFSLKLLIVPLLQIIMFGMGTTMSLEDFKGVIKMPRGVLIGVLCQFTIMPIVGFSIAKTFGFPPEIAAGIILVGSSPSGLASNVMAFIAKANIALSITLTAVATMLAPIMTPFLMEQLAGEFVPIDFWGMMLGIFNMVIVPVVAGFLFHWLAFHAKNRQALITLGITLALVPVIWLLAGSFAALESFRYTIPVVFVVLALAWALRKNAAAIESFMPLVSMAGIAVIIVIITASGRDNLLNIGALLILATLIHNLVGYFLGYTACKLSGMDERSCRTIALEVGLQNGGLASGLAVEMGKEATVGLAPAVFGPLMNITGSSLATWWRGRPTDAPQTISEKPEKDKALR